MPGYCRHNVAFDNPKIRGGPIMNRRDALKLGATSVVVAAAIPASAQHRLGRRLKSLEKRIDARTAPKMKMTTNIPASIMTPDKVETRIGTLNFFDRL